MSINIDFKKEEGYVHATVSGTFSKESALPVFEKILLYAAASKNYNFLIDCRKIEGDMPTEELMSFSQKSDEIQDDYDGKGWISEMRNAYLFDPSQHDQDQINEAVYNSDKDDFIISVDHEEAVNWLKSK